MRPQQAFLVLTSAMVMWCSQPASAQSPPQPAEPFAMDTIQARLSASFRFGPAIGPVGHDALFSVTGRTALHFHRPSGAVGPASIELVLRDSNGAQAGRWSLAPPVRQEISVPQGEGYELAVHVVDDIAGGEGWADTIRLDARALDSNGAIKLVNGTSLAFDPEQFKPACRQLAALPAEAALVSSGAVNMTALASEVTDIRFVASNYELALTVAPFKHKHLRFVDVSIFAKDLFGKFEPACHQVRFDSNSKERHLLASLPGSRDGTIWRVETTVSRSKDAADLPVPIVSFRSRPGETTRLGLEKMQQLAGYLCRSMNPYRGATTDKGERRFARKVRLNVSLEDPGFPLTPALRNKLIETILSAVKLWVEGCNTCRPDHLLIVEIDRVLYVDGSILALTDSALTKGGVFRAGASVEEIESGLNSFLNGMPIFTGYRDTYPSVQRLVPMMFPFRMISSEEKFAKLCALSSSPDTAPILNGIRNAICTPYALDPALTANIMVRFRHGPTACGNDRNIIACRADHELTEYNVRDFSFRTDDPVLSIGKGRVKLSLLHVMAHEIGHWIGLEHSIQGESIMADSYQQSRCINTSDATAITAARPAAAARPLAFTLRAAKKKTIGAGQSPRRRIATEGVRDDA